MPHSYSAVWVHIIWCTKNREPILTIDLRKELFEVIKTIATDHEIYIDCINGIEDHVHLLVRLRTDQSIADIVKTIKGGSWENFKGQPEKYIMWQDGFAVFSVSPGNLKNVRNYIYNQVKHHQHKDFKSELQEIKESTKNSDGYKTHRYLHYAFTFYSYRSNQIPFAAAAWYVRSGFGGC